jgi:acyl carrier protein
MEGIDMFRAQIMACIEASIEEVNATLPPAEKIRVHLDTCLYGDDGVLDSVGLVSLIVALEQALQDTMDLAITLADEKALSRRRSPFRTVATLLDYISTFATPEAVHA